MNNAINTAAAPVFSTGRIFQTKDAMQLLGFSDSTSFWQAVKRSGLPYVRISARRAIFRETDLTAWMDSRVIGSVGRGGGV